MITLTIKKKWFDMILSGEKREEYREIKPYYDSRLPKEFGMFKDGNRLVKGNTYPPSDMSKQKIQFRNGYGKDSPCFTAICSLSIGTGKVEWGAEQDVEYYRISIHEITERRKTNAD